MKRVHFRVEGVRITVEIDAPDDLAEVFSAEAASCQHSWGLSSTDSAVLVCRRCKATMEVA